MRTTVLTRKDATGWWSPHTQAISFVDCQAERRTPYIPALSRPARRHARQTVLSQPEKRLTQETAMGDWWWTTGIANPSPSLSVRMDVVPPTAFLCPQTTQTLSWTLWSCIKDFSGNQYLKFIKLRPFSKAHDGPSKCLLYDNIAFSSDIC